MTEHHRVARQNVSLTTLILYRATAKNASRKCCFVIAPQWGAII